MNHAQAAAEFSAITAAWRWRTAFGRARRNLFREQIV